MCGIVGYIGSRQAMPILVEGLSRLEYRGYDSAGIAVMNGSSLEVVKAKGRLSNLEARLEQTPLHGTIGIGHTRWATHGEPSDLNAHPHTDVKGDIAVVHNGIIENHDALRRYLQAAGCVFVSQTDTEVIAHLIHHLYRGNMLEALTQAASMLEGSYALGVVCVNEPGTLYCTRKDSPLIIGQGQNEQFIASDIPAIIAHTRDILLLEDRQIGVLRPDAITLYDPYGAVCEARSFHVDWDVAAAEKGGYPHFMLKEIHEEPEALKKTFSAHEQAAFAITAEEARSLRRLTIAACGTAYHAGVAGRYIIEKLARLPVDVELASEFRYRQPMLDESDLFLAVSQSGETADTLAALREAKRLGARTMALCNVVGSSIAREVGPNNVLYTWAGPEIAVASTKAYITQVEMLTLLAIDLGLKRGTLASDRAEALRKELAAIPAQAQQLLEQREEIQKFASRYFDQKHVFYIGRGLDYALAMEASLKLKEVSYIFSEAYAAGELKHGTIALIEPGTLVAAMVTQQALVDKTLSNIREVKSRGAHTLVLCPERLKDQCAPEADDLWLIPDASDELLPLTCIIPLQLLAYYMAVSRGCDVDKPRNLAKRVTVE